MVFGGRSEFIDFIAPPGHSLNLYDRSKPPNDQPANDAADASKAISQGFIDAMVVRDDVFVKEQGVPRENELDEDDRRSFHWVAYASVASKNRPADGRRSSTSTKMPIGTIRLVPPPHTPHIPPGAKSAVHTDEAYIKLGRLAVLKDFRKAGISRLLIDTALTHARDHSSDVLPYCDPTRLEALRQSSGGGKEFDWNGLVLLHSQVGAKRVWERYGFKLDKEMGEWEEEGIPHVGMWKRLDVSGRRRSRQW
ncbi:hypothetical protein K470DRAFT_247864 [Piedraia hortae CBS 480.64]|uniref:N-acetyltransferase domain-containing protein n=1 Tax=Piedraia hortae CBS 480.64 TaxID=1314780 RepID=A0A6A7BZW6_9PEZI|nr:hypothetical protein K470DRAFT_247864 [Piedraia hortae CBS 480.64]